MLQQADELLCARKEDLPQVAGSKEEGRLRRDKQGREGIVEVGTSNLSSFVYPCCKCKTSDKLVGLAALPRNGIMMAKRLSRLSGKVMNDVLCLPPV